MPAGFQGACDSSYAFAATGTTEAKIVLSGLDPLNLSEQQLISCGREGTEGCCEWDMTALDWYNFDLARDEACNGYLEADTECGDNSVSCPGLGPCALTYDLSSSSPYFHRVDTSIVKQVNALIFYSAPGYFRFDVYEDFYHFWDTYPQGWVYHFDPQSVYVDGHAVLIIGWDDDKQAWLCRNSWGETAGPNGDGTFWFAYDQEVEPASLNIELANYRNFEPNVAPVARCFEWDELGRREDSIGREGEFNGESCLVVTPDDLPDGEVRGNIAFGPAGIDFYINPLVTIARGARGDDLKRPRGWPDSITRVCSRLSVSRYFLIRRYCIQF